MGTNTGTRPRSREKLLTLCEGAITIALAYALSFVEIDLWVNGGSVGFVMLPLIVFALRRGALWGVCVGLIFGTIKCFFAGGFAWGWQSILLDYSVAYAAVGLAGFFRGRKWGMVLGTVVGCLGRFVIHFISGITIYAIIAPTELFQQTFTSPWMYSLAYNGSYMLVSGILVGVVLAVLWKTLGKRLF